MVGAGLAGLLAAAGLAATGRRVSVLERDALPAAARTRPGVPQAAHQHVLLHRGRLAAEALLPGLSADLLAAGAVRVDTGRLLWLAPQGWAPPDRGGIALLAASRPLLESVVRARVRALPQVRLLDRRDVRGLSLHRGRVRGVLTATGDRVDAALVVDATGRSSRLPAWLAAAGYPRPAEELVDARVGYASRRYAAPRGCFGGAGLFVLTSAATGTGGNALPVEGGEWLVTAIGLGERLPPRDDAGFAAFLAGLRDPALAAFVEAAAPRGPLAVHRQGANRWRHYERMTGLPAGLLVLGDALCAFNPAYGQGITVAAVQAARLRRLPAGPLRPGSQRRLQRRLARPARLPWAIATGEDLRHPGTVGSPTGSQRLAARYADAVADLATHGDLPARRAMERLYHLTGSPAGLLAPGLLARLARARLVGPGPAVGRPDGALAVPAPEGPVPPGRDGVGRPAAPVGGAR